MKSYIDTAAKLMRQFFIVMDSAEQFTPSEVKDDKQWSKQNKWCIVHIKNDT